MVKEKQSVDLLLNMLKSHNFIVPVIDTDSITVCKQSNEPFSKEEIELLTKELNDQFDELINWELEFNIPKLISLKAKNYILDYGNHIHIKGSALKATQKEQALKEFIKEIIDSMLNERNDYSEIYNKYIREACSVKDIKRWSARKTISDKTLNSERTNEARIRDAIQGSEVVEGDRVYVFFKDKETLELVDNFNGEYCVDKLLKKVYDTAWTFESVLDCDALFPNYALKKNKKALEDLLNG